MSPPAVPFPKPTAGDVVLCWFPQNLIAPSPGPKRRPAIVLETVAPAEDDPSAAYGVIVCYGTSNLHRLYAHELEITIQHGDEFTRAGLASDTKFNLRQRLVLPFTSEWFTVPRQPRFGHTPKLGDLHPATVPRLLKAYAAATGDA